ncbi:hypothetical protein POM88_040602 [Heracleum sosnowskyi]|uniref:Leucine zipper with capping helix domain-containing protein n=1 Tax=Heracleum sosnowskyi TaxID=360622 RepID=A0AAD8M8Y6_9APIA|nr:hypothetical protein POM88_040602 [Heracleum sosnowskyi]
MAQFVDNDPAAFEAMISSEIYEHIYRLNISYTVAESAIEVAHAAANRWTDNIFTLQQWCSNNFAQAKEPLEHLYEEIGIKEDFDYLKLPAIPAVISNSRCTITM